MIMLLFLVARLLEFVEILNRIVMLLWRSHVSWCLRIESIHRVLRVDSLNCVCGVWRLDEGLRAYRTRLHHRLVEVLRSLVHIRALSKVG